MINAKQELISFLKEAGHTLNSIKCAGLYFADDREDLNLKIEGDKQESLDKLNFVYDNGYGSQKLFGRIWFIDNTWAEREEYDGSEWWEHRALPEIPKELK